MDSLQEALPKFSRYKSVKRATAGASPAPPLPNFTLPSSSANIDRSASRYRRGRAPNGVDKFQSVPALPKNQIPFAAPPLVRSNTAEQGIVPVPQREVKSEETSPTVLNKAQQEAFDILTGKVDRQQDRLKQQLEKEREHREKLAEDFRRKSKDEQAKREELRRAQEARLNAEREARARRQAERRAEEITQEVRSVDTGRAIERTPGVIRQDFRRPSEVTRQALRKHSIGEAQNSTRTVKSHESLAQSPNPACYPSGEDGALGARRKDYADLGFDRQGQSLDPTGMGLSRKLSKRQGPKYSKSADPITFMSASRENSNPSEPAKEASAPNFDAPKSAVNAGVRMVKVMYGEKSMKLPVTPTSTPVDLLTSAKDLLEYGFDPQRYVLQEYFKQLELQRPLRQYEHVRDVMNSWNSDEQHWFNIVSASTEWDSAGLKYANASRTQPEETSVTVYHSQRPRVWDKRCVTLRSDGQVVIQKHSGAAAINICHMSDFDVFMPTRKEVKELKAPRKFCFAIKSQQKPAMFLNTANFVHFISTKDQNLAMEWYQAIHGWRSWYLVNTLGLGKEPTKAVADEPKEPLVANIRGRNFSTTSSTQQPLSPGFTNRMLPDLNLVTSPSAESPKQSPLTRSFNTRGGPPVSFPRNLNQDADSGSRARARSTSRTRSSSTAREQPPGFAPEPFAESGLLGRTYTLRRQALDNEQDNDLKIPDLPGKPLVDLTAERKEAPQFSRKGRGVVLDSVPTGGLVLAATSNSPEHAPPSVAAGDLQAVGAGLARSNSRRTRTLRNGTHPQDAFTGGLLAQTGDGQGDRRRGRGIAVGNRNATEPMLNMEEASKYVPGSLLESVERYEDRGPVIQRDRGREIDIRVGEGM